MANEVMLKTEAQQIRQTALSALVSGRELLNKSYLSELGQFDLQTLDKFPSEKIDFFADVRIFKVERIVLENKQSMLESITAAYTALGAAGYSVFLLLQSMVQKLPFILAQEAKLRERKVIRLGNF